jgi:Mg-chelatase subunit ChlD
MLVEILPGRGSGDLSGELDRYFGDKPDGDRGWQIAQAFHEAKRQMPSPEVRQRAREIAAKAILWRAAEMVGAARRSATPLRLPYSVAGRGEMLMEETLENIVGFGDAAVPRPEDIIMEVREQKRIDAVLMIDTSLSMTGQNLALAGVAAAVLAYKLHPRDYSLVVFEGTATVAKPLNVGMPREQAVSRILEVPAMGYTNIEDALRKGLRQLERGRNRERIGILITDGFYTEGGNPLPWAAKYPRLYVLMTEAYKMSRELCYEMARQGRGRCFPVKGYGELPYALSKLLREILR